MLGSDWWLGVIVVALVVSGWLWGRWRLRRQVYEPGTCPRCGGHIWHRARRRLTDHLFGIGMGLRRYRCANWECNWDGIRQIRQ